MSERMTERELCAYVDEAERKSAVNSGSFYDDNEKYLKYYMGEPFGDEVDGQSQVISTDVRDLIEADMPSLARVFLGAGDPVEFRSATKDLMSIQEAKDKQALVSYIIKTTPNSFRTQHDWLKAGGLQTISALEYGVEDVSYPRMKRYKGLSEDDLVGIIQEIEGEKTVKKVTISEKDDNDDGSYNVTLNIICSEQRNFMRCVPVEDFIISKNAWNKDDADVVGKKFSKSRSQLISEGFDRDTVDSLPSKDSEDRQGSLKTTRYDQQGGESDSSVNNHANDMIEGIDCYIRIDYDGDGIAERRHIIKVGSTILENEPFDHVPYALFSSMLMPNNVMGLPRAELVMQDQRVNSVLQREILNNIYAVNHPRTFYNDSVDVDDLLDIRLNGIVHVDGIPQQSIMAAETPYIGDRALQVVAYLDGKKEAKTGANQGNQALQADNLHKETATRSEIMETAATAKIELVARVIAETGYKELWEGVAWFAAHYQDEELEQRVLGRPMVQNPKSWKYDHYICAQVGTGAGDDEKTMANLTGIYQLQQSLKQQGSMLSDDQKIYNTLVQMVKTTGRDAVDSFFNNPEKPEQMVVAERDMLKKQVEQLNMQLQQANPLAEAEQVKAQSQAQIQQLKQNYEGQLEMMKMQNANQQKITDLQAKYQSDLQKMELDYKKHMDKVKFDYTKLMTDQGNSVGEVENAMAAMSDEQLMAIVMGQTQ